MKSRSQDRDHVGNSRVHRKSGRLSEVLEELAEKSRSLLEKLIGTHQEDHHEVQELGGSLPEHCREIVGSSPEDRRKLAGRIDLQTLFSLEYVLGIVVSM